MILKNKRGAEGGVNYFLITMVIALVLLGVYLVMIKGHQTIIKDASSEVNSWLNVANPNCDFDKDGLNNVADICPCDDDNDYGSRIYYLKGSQCSVTKIQSYEKIDYEEKLIECEESGKDEDCPKELPSESMNWVYSVPLVDKECVNAVKKILEDDNLIGSTLCEVKNFDKYKADKTAYYQLSGLKEKLDQISKDKSTTPVLLFPEKCATRILAQNIELNRATFTCRTQTMTCKKKLTDEKCT